MATKKKTSARKVRKTVVRKKGSARKKAAPAKARVKAAAEVVVEPEPEVIEVPEAVTEPPNSSEIDLSSTLPTGPVPEPIRLLRVPTEPRSEEEDKAIRSMLRRGEKALEIVQEIFDTFEPGPGRAVVTAMKRVADELETLRPPKPRKCKEFKRALGLARKGEMGIHPDDIVRYCRCEECQALREKEGMEHPPSLGA
jgi:hypothetical protein